MEGLRMSKRDDIASRLEIEAELARLYYDESDADEFGTMWEREEARDVRRALEDRLARLEG